MNTRTIRHFFFLLIFAAPLVVSVGQSYNLRFVLLTNNGSQYTVKVQMNGSATFRNGGGNICFSFDTASVHSPVLDTAYNFSGGLYSTLSVTQPLDSVASINIEYNGTSGNGTSVVATPSWTDVAAVRFTTRNISGASRLQFRSTSSAQAPTVMFDDAFNQLTGGTFTGLSTSPLPVELLSFSAVPADGNVELHWTTVSELNNLGFRIQRSSGQFHDWLTLAFVPGAGTVDYPRVYRYSDRELPPGGAQALHYRLIQVDRDGTEDEVARLAIQGQTPTGFRLGYPYPNPSSGTFAAAISMDEPSEVTLRLYDSAGHDVYTREYGTLSSGVHILQISVPSLAPGPYYMSVQTSVGNFTTNVLTR